MPRRRRSYLPGQAFHITTRMIAKEHWLVEDIRDQVVEIFLAPRNCDARLIAHCVMSNHIHLVVRQGVDPLGQLMHVIKHRIARVVQRRLKRTGCIFERRFFERPAVDQEHFRAMIAYTHLNAWYAGMCDHPDAYKWSSHGLYCGTQSPSSEGHDRLYPAVEAFAREPECSIEQARGDYRQYVEYLMYLHELKSGIDLASPGKPRCATQGSAASNIPCRSQATIEEPRDLRDIALATLAEKLPDLPIDCLRFTRGNAEVVAARHEIIRRCTLAGYRPVDIAQFLRMSPNRVSEIAATAPWRAPRFFSRTRVRMRPRSESDESTGGPP